MKTSIIKIGNSKGLRLSKTILEKYKIKNQVELILEDDHIILKPMTQPRLNWEEQFIQMNERGDDNLLIDDMFEDENLEEWI